MSVTDDFACKRHYTNSVNCMLGKKKHSAKPCRFAVGL